MRSVPEPAISMMRRCKQEGRLPAVLSREDECTRNWVQSKGWVTAIMDHVSTPQDPFKGWELTHEGEAALWELEQHGAGAATSSDDTTLAGRLRSVSAHLKETAPFGHIADAIKTAMKPEGRPHSPTFFRNALREHRVRPTAPGIYDTKHAIAAYMKNAEKSATKRRKAP